MKNLTDLKRQSKTLRARDNVLDLESEKARKQESEKARKRESEKALDRNDKKNKNVSNYRNR